jgi:hypothetical protein
LLPIAFSLEKAIGNNVPRAPAGQPQASLYGFGIVLLYIFVCGRLRESGRAARLAGGIAAGVGLAAPLWLPLAELAQHSTRAAGVPAWPELRLAAFDLYPLFVPFAGEGGRGPLSASPASLTRCGLIECVSYPGIAIWLLVLAAPALWLRDRRARFWLAVAVASLLGATGVLGSALDLRVLERPARLLLGWSMAVSALGGLALSAWMADPGRARRRSWITAAAIGALIAWLALRHPDARLAALLGTPPGYDAIGYVNDPTLAAPGSHVLDLLRVRVLSAPARASLALEEALWKHPDRFEPFHAGGDERITYFRNRQAYPVAWLVPRFRSVAPGAAIATVRDDSAIGGFDPAQEALVEEAPAAALDPECWRRAEPGSERVSLVEYADDRLRFRISAPCAGILVTSELAYPGWQAHLDSDPTALLRVNGAFRGALVPAGEHTLELRYRPTLPWIARGLAATTLLTLVIAARSHRPDRIGRRELERGR